ncbi:MAG TPA: Holliday junction branch migration protein RuvA [Clostridiaceae bacterium]|nr:Holliday junction branch migration protein RuvA [Clostridiaceae bacterium]
MFAYIKGTLVCKCSDYLIVEANGIGYKVFTSISTLESAGRVGEQVKLYTYLYVREDAIVLYGFLTQEELGMFELLISVTGIGPKAAISLLSYISPSKFGLAVITGDTKTLTKAPGIGKKTAQRIILELQDKIKKEQFTLPDGESGKEDVPEKYNSTMSEAVSALMVLGYSGAEASRAVSKVYSDNMDLETIIKESLKQMIK